MKPIRMKEDSWVFRYIALVNATYRPRWLHYKDLDTCSVFSAFLGTTFCLGMLSLFGFSISMALTLGMIGLGAWLYLDLSWEALIAGPYGDFVTILLIVSVALGIVGVFVSFVVYGHKLPKALRGVSLGASDLAVLVGAKLSKVCFKIELCEEKEETIKKP